MYKLKKKKRKRTFNPIKVLAKLRASHAFDTHRLEQLGGPAAPAA